MPVEDTAAVLQAAAENILAITSACNLNCLFCSHQGNPPGLKVFRIKPRTLEQVAAALDFVDPRKKLLIGESAGRIEEGEPFTHPRIKELLMLVRRRLPETLLSITTNGTLLSSATLDWLGSLQPLELVISLNCLEDKAREQVLGDRQLRRAPAAVTGLARRGIKWHASLVAMPHLTGWADLEATIDYCLDYGCATIRIFLPGYTRWSPAANTFDLSLWDELQQFVTGKGRQADIPLLLEPPRCRDLVPRVAGVMPGTAAAKAGLKVGDIITTVNSNIPRTRAEAFFLCRAAASPRLLVSREQQLIQLVLDKPAHSVPGFAVDRDMDPEIPRLVHRVITQQQSRHPLLLTSVAAAPVWQAAAGIFNLPGELKITAVANCFFGGSIITAGLLTVSDFAYSLAAAQDYDLVLLPSIPFDSRGKDLTGRSWTELLAMTDAPVMMLP